MSLRLSLTPAEAIELLQLDVRDIAYPPFKALGVVTNVRLISASTIALEITAESLLAPPYLAIQNLRLTCESVSLTGQRWHCPHGTLQGHSEHPGNPISTGISLTYEPVTERLSIQINDMTTTAGHMSFNLEVQDSRWHVQLRDTQLDLQQTAAWAQPYLAWLQDYADFGGAATLRGDIRGNTADITQLHLDIKVKALSFNGPNVAEDADAELLLKFRQIAEHQSAKGLLRFTGGVVYFEPGIDIDGFRPGFTIEAPAQPLTLAFVGAGAQGGNASGRIQLKHTGVLSAAASGDLRLTEPVTIENGKMHATSQDLAKAYEVYLQPLLMNSALGSLQAKGQLWLNAKIRDNSLADLRVAMQNVNIDDDAGRFSVAGLQGDMSLNSGPTPKRSHLSWREAGLFRLTAGAGDVALTTRNRRIELERPIRIPMLDGEFQIDDLSLIDPGGEDFALRMDLNLTPISLSDLCLALGWTEMAGQVSGHIPGLSYTHGELSVPGQLKIQAFGGETQLRHLTVSDLLGYAPRLSADIDIKGLDLETLSRTFSFGKIEGSVDGYIKALQLEAWEPVSFDFSLTSVQDDPTRHRISQRAVDNLTNIGGGGAAGALSKSFLRFFDDFAYDRLGIKCRLSKGVCQMDGVEATLDGGYYIVKRGLRPPWLNIKGYNPEVNWDELITRLKRVSQGGGPTIY